MGRQIILKDNGEIAVWSTVCDDFVYEGPMHEYAISETEIAADEKRAEITDTYNALMAGQKPYRCYQMTYKDACDLRDSMRHAQKGAGEEKEDA